MKTKNKSFLKGNYFVAILLAVFFLSSCGEAVPPPFDEQTKGSIKFGFQDTDTNLNQVSGKVKLVIPATLKLETVTHFVLYWSRTASESGKGSRIVEIPKASLQNGVLHIFNANSSTDKDKKFILLYLKNSKVEISAEVPTNEAYSSVSVKVDDLNKSDIVNGVYEFKKGIMTVIFALRDQKVANFTYSTKFGSREILVETKGQWEQKEDILGISNVQYRRKTKTGFTAWKKKGRDLLLKLKDVSNTTFTVTEKGKKERWIPFTLKEKK
jgi:hypothetical protein